MIVPICPPPSFSSVPIVPALSMSPDVPSFVSVVIVFRCISCRFSFILSPSTMFRFVIVPAFSIPYSLLVALLLPVPSIAFCAPNDRLPPDSLFIPASVPSIVPSKLELPPSFICPMSPALSIP